MTSFFDRAFDVADTTPWIAIRTFNCQEEKVRRFLELRGYPQFVPMAFSDRFTSDDPPQRILVPAIHNLVFLRKVAPQKVIAADLRECGMPLSVYHEPGSPRYSEISARDILELRMLCDPQYPASVFMTQDEAATVIGKRVRVIHGPFKGCVGRLVRKGNKFWFLKVVIGMGVMIRISRWYCEVLCDDAGIPC